jgi:F-type H+-transporting ATPase subunit gamma
METIEAVRRRIKNVEDLGSITRSMRALAAASIRQYERAVESLADYHRITEMGMQVALAHAAREGREPITPIRKPIHERTTAVIVFGSDQGMCGQFNEHIAAHAVEQLTKIGLPPEKRQVWAVGVRAAGSLEHAGQPVLETLVTPSSAAGITPMVQELLLRSGQWRGQREGEIEQVFLFYNQLTSASAYRPQTQRLLPINISRLPQAEEMARWPSRAIPQFTMDWQPLFSALLRQHLFVSLFRAFAESLASENATRLLAMQAAERNIEERLEELTALYHYRRQDAITSELLDIISGFEMLTA